MRSLIVIATVLAIAAAQAVRYPANLNPALCPNYPECDNRIIATYGPASAVQPVAPVPRNYPAGVSPAACPNYPYCGSSVYTGIYTREYPAGVPAAACPNYPYCH